MKNVCPSVSGEPKSLAKVFVPGSPAERSARKCLINENWEESHLVTLVIIRSSGNVFTLTGFLVDLLGVGLRDVFLYHPVSRGLLNSVMAEFMKDVPCAECSLPLAQELVYGVFAWAQKHGYKVPPNAKRCLDIAARRLEMLPPPEGEPNLSRFGTEGAETGTR